MIFKAILITKSLGKKVVMAYQKQGGENIGSKEQQLLHRVGLLRRYHGLFYDSTNRISFVANLLSSSPREPVAVEIGDYILTSDQGLQMLISNEQYHQHFDFVR